jgi:hypothetical protein
MHYVYGLIDPRDSSVRYIGITSNPVQRYGDHLHDHSTIYANRKKQAWIKELKELHLVPHMHFFRCTKNEEDAHLLEKCYLLIYRMRGVPLLNSGPNR